MTSAMGAGHFFGLPALRFTQANDRASATTPDAAVKLGQLRTTPCASSLRQAVWGCQVSGGRKGTSVRRAGSGDTYGDVSPSRSKVNTATSMLAVLSA